MKILVCFKATPKVEMFLDQDWVVDKQHKIDTSFVRSELSSYDESALEMALKLSDAAQGLSIPMELNAFTVDNRSAAPILKTLNALQFETVVRVEPREDLLFQPTAVAAIISQYIREMTFQDVVMLGRQSDIGENAKTPLLTAEMLGWPCITQATQIEPADEAHLIVTHQVDDGYAREKVRMPIVISVGDAPCSYLRKPTLRDRLNYGKKTIEVLSVDAFDLPAETEALTDLTILRHERAGRIIEGESPAEKATVLYEEYLKPVLSQKKGLL
jgi:electron transfer flavoprotein alpha/beta subunit